MAVNINHYTDNIVSSGSALFVNNFRLTTVGSGATIGSAGIVTYYGDGSQLTGVSAVPTPGGTDTQIQFNDNGSLGGDSGLTYNKTTDVLSITGGAIIGTGVTIIPAGLRINTGIVTASSFVKSGGTSSQFLKADGSTDSNTYLIAENDTLNSVTTRGNTTANNITVGALIASSISKSGGTSSQFLKADGTVDSNTYLTSYSETDTLDSVTTRGRTTTNGISVGLLTATSFVKSGGTSSQFLKADGTVDSNTYLTSYTETSTLDNVTTRGRTTTNGISVGLLTATSFVKSGGTSSQFLKADGTVDSNTYLTSYTETDTLDSVTTRGRTTTNGISVGLLTATNANVVGVITAAYFKGDGSQLTGVTAAAAIEVKDEGSSIGDPATILNFVGQGVTATYNAGTATITISGGSGGGGTPGGTDTQIQFNDGGSTFGGDSGLTYNKTTDNLSVTGGINVGTGVTISPNGLQINTGIITASSFKIPGGTQVQFLKANGTVDSNTYLTTTGSGTNLTGIVTSIAAGSGISIDQSTGKVTITASGGSGSPGGSDTQIQFNDGGLTFGGDSGLTYNKTTDVLSATGGVNVGTGVTIIPAGIRINTGIITASKFVVPGGTAQQFLKANGDVDNSTYLTTYTETDTLDSVTTRGRTTTNGISVGVLTATSFVKSGGTSSQFLKADGSVDTSTYLTYYQETSTLDSLTTRGRTTTNGISVGLLTATNANVVGVVTATSFVGDGSGLTNLPSGGGSSQWVTTNAGIHTLSNVGIGTTNPTSTLQVQGTVSVSSTTTSSEFVGGGSNLRNLLGTHLVTYASHSETSNSALSITGISTYNQVGILTGSLAVDANDFFGYSVATSADGKTIIVGVYNDETGAVSDTGLVYVYDRVGTSFNQVGILTGSLAVDTNDFFGYSVATSADGKTIVVSAYFDEIGATTSTGVVYVYDRVGTSFNQVGILTGSLAVNSDGFGDSVTCSADGKTIIVGASEDETGATSDTGVVYVFDRVGNSFNQVGILTGSLAVDSGDGFGRSVATSADGKTIIVGAYFDEIGATTSTGVVYVYDRVGNSFNQVGILTGSLAVDNGNYFGSSVATSADGKTIVVGARFDDGATEGTGLVYVYDRVGTSFNQVGILTGSLAVDSGDSFGRSVVTSADGKTIIVGADGDEIGATTSTGVVYVFNREGNSFNQVAILTGSLAVDSGDVFGISVAASADGKTIIVGARNDEIGATTSTGLAYVFDQTRETYVYSGPTGNVGIGTTNPTSKLHVVGGANIVGTVTATSFKGDGSQLTGVVATGSGVVIQEEGSTVGTATTLNFVGAGATATFSNGTTTITISGGSGGGGTPGGTDTQIQFNDGGSTFGGDSGLTYNKTTDNLSVTGGINVGTGVTISPNGLRINTGITTLNNVNISNLLVKDFSQIQVEGFGGTYGDTSIEFVGGVPGITNPGEINFYLRSGISNYHQISFSNGSFYPADGLLSLGNPSNPWNVLYSNGAVFSASTIGDMVRITQTGTGNALVVEDETNPDASPFVIRANGSVGIGTVNPTEKLHVVGNALITGIVTATNANVVGVITAAYFKGDGSQLTGVTAAAVIAVQEEGSTVGAAVTTLNFVGLGATATVSGGTATITISGGGGSGGISSIGPNIVFDGDGYNLRGLPFTPLSPYASHSETSNLSYSVGRTISYSQLTTVNGQYAVDSNDYFGQSVAMSADGSTFAIAAPNDETPSSGADSGVVYVYDREGYRVTNVGILTSSSGKGTSLAMSADGRTIIIGSSDQTNVNAFAGKVYVVDRVGYGSSTNFRIGGVLTGSLATDAFDNFGNSVTCSADGKTIIVGANSDEAGATSDTGVVYVFDRQGDSFSQVGIITATVANQGVSDLFGGSVACSANGKTIIIGSTKDETSSSDSGLVYIFDRTGNTFVESVVINSSQPALNGNFGCSVDCSADGKTIVVGASAAGSGGLVYVYDRTSSTSVVENTILNPPAGSGSEFGQVVTCSADGKTIIVSAPAVASSAGRLYVYSRQKDRYELVSTLSGNLSSSFDRLATSLACSADGKFILAGAERDETSGGVDRSGLAYVFERNLDTSLYASTNGNIGIGTTNTGSTRLYVHAGSQSIAGVFSGTTSGDMVRITQSGTGNALVVEDETSPDSTPFVVRPDGSIGIGINPPTEKLHVVGNALITGIVTATSFKGDGSQLTGVVASGSGVPLQDDNSLVGTATTINFGAGLTVSTVVGGISTINANPYWNVNNAGISTTSNIGIGTTNPIRSLTIVGSGASISNLYITGVATFQSNAYFGNNDVLYFGNSFNNAIFYDGANFEIGSTNQVRITSLSEPLAVFNPNGSVELYHDNSKKLETTVNGVLITGETSSTTKTYAPRIGYYSLYATHDFSTQTFTVTVSTKSGSNRYFGSGSADAYYINGDESPFITFVPGKIYRFDQSDASNAGHPLRFYYDSAKTTQYTANITTSGTAGLAGAYTEITVTDQTPLVLHYQCSNHAFMGNAVQTNSNHIDTPYLITARSGVNVTGVVTATDFNTTSDQNLKTNISTIEKPIEKLNQIRGVNFEWKSTNEKSIGVIAQEIEKVLPELVKVNEDKKHVNYNGLIGLLIEVVKEQQEQIEELKRRIT